jgi:hypothetical protein
MQYSGGFPQPKAPDLKAPPEQLCPRYRVTSASFKTAASRVAAAANR